MTKPYKEIKENFFLNIWAWQQFRKVIGMSSIISVLNDQLQGNIFSGSIISCRFAGQIICPCGPVAFVGDQVIATGPVGITVQTHTGTITTGLPNYIAPDGSHIAVVGVSQFIAGPFSGIIVGPGCPGYITL